LLVCPAAATLLHLFVEEMTCRGQERRRESGLFVIGLIIILGNATPRYLLKRGLQLTFAPSDALLGGVSGNLTGAAISAAFGALVPFPLWLAYYNAEGGATALFTCALCSALATWHARVDFQAALVAAALCVAIGFAAAPEIKRQIMRLRGPGWVVRGEWHPTEAKLWALRAQPALSDASFPTPLKSRRNRSTTPPTVHEELSEEADEDDEEEEEEEEDAFEREQRVRSLFSDYVPRPSIQPLPSNASLGLQHRANRASSS